MSTAYKRRKKSTSSEDRRKKTNAKDAVSPGLLKQLERKMNIDKRRMETILKDQDNVPAAIVDEVTDVVAEEVTPVAETEK